MPDTAQTIAILETAALNLGVSIGRDQAIHDAMLTAASQLKGILQTQLAELANANLQLDRLTENNGTLTAQLDEKDATIATLTTALEDNNIALPADTPVEAAPE